MNNLKNKTEKPRKNTKIPNAFWEDYEKVCPSFEAISSMEENRDVYALSYLAIASASIPNYFTYYRSDVQVSPHLYMAFWGESGCGKSACTDFVSILYDINRKMREESILQIEKYREQVKTKSINPSVEREPPVRKILFGSNITDAGLIKVLKENENGGLISSSEISILSKAMSNDFGANISGYLRSSSHHELISKDLGSDSFGIFIERPRLALLIAGTPKQAEMMFQNNVENGLFGRFCFYKMDFFRNQRLDWEEENDESKSHAKFLAKKDLEEIFFSLKSRQSPLFFWATKEQKKDFITYMNLLMEKFEKIDDFFGSLVARFSMTAWRFTMLFAIFRQKENIQVLEKIQCSDADIAMSINLCEFLLSESVLLNRQMSKKWEKKVRYDESFVLSKMNRFFSTHDFSEAAKKLGNVSYRTSSRWIEKLTAQKRIKKTSKGSYETVSAE